MQNMIERKIPNSKNNISIVDEKDNLLLTNYAEYFEKDEIIKTVGKTKVQTKEKYNLEGSDLYFDNKNKLLNLIKNQL